MTRHTAKIAALTGALCLSAAPAMAQYTTSQYTATSLAAFEDCKKKDTEGQVLGAVLGGVLGGVVGNEVEKGEGTVIGGAAGAYAGTQVANKDCQKLLVPQTQVDAYNQSEYTTYDVRSGQYIDTRTGAVVTTTPREPVVAGAIDTRTEGMVRVTDDAGNVFYISEDDYRRYYR